MLSYNNFSWVYKAKFWRTQKGELHWHNPVSDKVEVFHPESSGEGPHEEVSDPNKGKADFSKPTDERLSEVRTLIGGDSKIVYRVSSDGTIDINSLRTKTKGQGKGSAQRLLSSFLGQADAEGRPVTLVASPLTKKTNPQRLVDFYKREGFSVSGAGNALGHPKMVRQPKKTTEEKKNRFRAIRIGGGTFGGRVISVSARSPGKIQVTDFTDKGTPSGHSEHDSLEEAIAEHWTELDNPVSNLARSLGGKRARAWEEATFESPQKSELAKKKYAYVSPLRPLSGVSVGGFTSTTKDGKIGVLYRDDPLDIETMKHLSLVPVTTGAIRDFSSQIARQSYQE